MSLKIFVIYIRCLCCGGETLIHRGVFLSEDGRNGMWSKDCKAGKALCPCYVPQHPPARKSKTAWIRKGNVKENRGTQAQGLRLDGAPSSFRGFSADCQAGRFLRFPTSTDLGMQLHKRGSRSKWGSALGKTVLQREEKSGVSPCPCKGQRGHCMSQTNGETTSFFRQALGLCGKDVPMSKAAEGVVPEGMMFVQQSLCCPRSTGLQDGEKENKANNQVCWSGLGEWLLCGFI